MDIIHFGIGKCCRIDTEPWNSTAAAPSTLRSMAMFHAGLMPPTKPAATLPVPGWGPWENAACCDVILRPTPPG